MRKRLFCPVAAIGWITFFLLSAAVPVAGQEPVDPAAGPGSPDAGKGDLYTFEDEVFVADKAPEIPSSNTVAAKLPLSLAETPASVSVVGAPLIAEQRAFVLGDALKNAAGVNVQSGNGVFDFFVVRGLDSVSSGLILTDGVPEPETTFYQLYNVERVEVLRGPASFLYGGSPLGGTVNLVRRQPVARDLGRVGLSAGSYGTYEGTLDLNRSNGDNTLSFRLNGLFQESDGYRDDKASHNYAVNPALTWRPSERTSLNVNLEHVDTEYKTDTGLPILEDFSFGGLLPGFPPAGIAPVPRERSYQSPFDVSDQEIERAQVDLESYRSDRLLIRNKTYFRRLEWLSAGTIFPAVFPDPRAGLRLKVFRSFLALDDEQELFGNQFEALLKLETGAVTHNLLLGAELSRLSDEFTFDVGLLPEIDLFAPVETATRPIFFLPGQSLRADARSDVAAPYAVDQIVFSDRFQLLVGLRFDAIDFEDDANRLSRSDSRLSPMVGIVVAPSPELSLYANAGEAFAPPSTFSVGRQPEPEEGRQFEAGIKRSAASGRLQASLAAFRIERQNIGIPDRTGILRQNGDQRSQGLELEVTALPREGMRLTASWAYTDSELTRFTEVFQDLVTGELVLLDHSGNRSPFAPRQLANLWLTQRLGGGVGVGLGGRYVGKQFISENNAFELDDYATLDAALSWERGRYAGQVNVKNLTDEEYFTRGFGASSVIPAPGLNAQASLAVRF